MHVCRTSDCDKYFVDDNGFVFCNDGTEWYLIAYRGEKTELILPADCKGETYKINQYTFNDCRDITDVTIPEGVMSIGKHAFNNCYKLKNVQIPISLTEIQTSAFYSYNIIININFAGTKEDWEAISKSNTWDSEADYYIIHCTDGDIAK